MPLKIAANLTLPDDAVTQTFGFIGHKGSGKSYAAMKLAELLLGADRQVVALDPVGVWYSLRLSADGVKPSKLKIPILGGLRGDVPLEPGAGKTVADFVVDTGACCVLDVSLFRKAQRKEFVADFAEELFYRQKAVRRPLHLFIEEAQVFAPQNPAKGEERMLGAIEDIVRIGRNFGLGASMITQRPQSVNKEVLNQVEPLIVFRMIASHEREAVKRWLQHVGADADKMLAEIHGLKTGDCYFWSPAWLDEFKKIRFAKRTTFDASSTPTGEDVAPAELKAVDLGKLQQAMAKSIEQAKANDPKELKRQIAELQRQLAARPAAAVDQAAVAKAVETAVKQRDRFWSVNVGRVLAAEANFREKATVLSEAIATLKEGPRSDENAIENKSARTLQTPVPPKVSAPVEKSAGKYATKYAAAADGSLSRMQRAFLTALAQHPAGLQKQQILILAGYRSSGDVSSCFAQLTRDGWTEGDRGRMVITAEGRAVLGPWDALPKGDELRELRIREAGTMEGKFLKALFNAYPESIAKGEVLEQAGYRSSGDVSSCFAKLVRVGWAAKSGSSLLRASDTFFED